MKSLNVSMTDLRISDSKTTFNSFTYSVHKKMQQEKPDLNWDGFFSKYAYIPGIIVLSILTKLDAGSLSRCCLVSRQWHEIASYEGLWQCFAPKDALGKDKWIQYYGDPGDVPPLPRAIVIALQEPCPFWKGKKVEETHDLMLMVSKVDQVGMTINNLDTIALKSKVGRPASFYKSKLNPTATHTGVAFVQHGETPVTKPYWVLITKDLVPGSVNLTGDQTHHDFISKYPRYRKGKAIELAAFAFMKYSDTGERLFPANVPSTTSALSSKSTYCLEHVLSGAPLMLGPFHSMDAQSADDLMGLELNVAGSSEKGLVLVREFKSPAPKKTVEPVSVILWKESELPSPLPFAYSKKDWEQDVGKVDEEPLVPSNLLEILQRPCPFWPEETTGQTHHVFWVPGTIDEKPLTLNSVGDKIELTRQQRGVLFYKTFSFHNFSPSILRQIGDDPLSGPVWIFMTKDLIPGTQGKSLAQVQEILKKYPGYQMPSASDLALGILTAFKQENVRSGAFKQGAFSWTKTEYKEKKISTTGSKKPQTREIVFEGNVAVTGYGSLEKHVDFQLFSNQSPSVGLVGVRIFKA